MDPKADKDTPTPSRRDALERATVAAVDLLRAHARRHRDGAALVRIEQGEPLVEGGPHRVPEVHVYLVDAARNLAVGPLRVGGAWRKRVNVGQTASGERMVYEAPALRRLTATEAKLRGL